MLYMLNASISVAPKSGCQGEVGVCLLYGCRRLWQQCSGRHPMRQVENAAEIGMEHNLGLTCDPVGGLVQVPCIERNAMGSVKAIHCRNVMATARGGCPLGVTG